MTVPYVTVDDGLVSQILLFFIFAIVAAILSKAIASLTSYCIRKKAARKKIKEKPEERQVPEEEEHINIPVPKARLVKTGLFAVLAQQAKDAPTPTLSHKNFKGSRVTLSTPKIQEKRKHINGAFDNPKTKLINQLPGV